jgi:hypothetical protein
MAYPTGLKIFIDGEDCTFYIFGTNTFTPTDENNIIRGIDITPYLRTIDNLSGDRYFKPNSQGQNIHTIEVTAEDGSGRVECRVEVR